jgi:hypothetical protein
MCTVEAVQEMSEQYTRVRTQIYNYECFATGCGARINHVIDYFDVKIVNFNSHILYTVRVTMGPVYVRTCVHRVSDMRAHNTSNRCP